MRGCFIGRIKMKRTNAADKPGRRQFAIFWNFRPRKQILPFPKISLMMILIRVRLKRTLASRAKNSTLTNSKSSTSLSGPISASELSRLEFDRKLLVVLLLVEKTGIGCKTNSDFLDRRSSF